MRQERASEVKSVGIWIRVSTEDQVRGESPEHHEQRARAYAELKGWHVAEVYRLDAVSGKAVMAHPTAKKMLADIRAGVITGLVFSKLARLARNTKELLDFAEVFRACDADMVSLAESIDTSTPAGRLFFTMIAAMAQWEREEIADRVKASIPVRAKLGKPLGGLAPFGYRWVDKKLEVDPKDAPVRVLAYELYAEHRRRKAVANILNARGYRTRAGAPFTGNSILRLIEDPSAKGLHRANTTRVADNEAGWEFKPEEEWIYTPVEPIVSEELWERCNSILESQRSDRKPAKRTRYLFAGFAFCHCGPKMYVPSNSDKYTCQACRTKIPVAELETVYREQLAAFLMSTDEVRGHLAAAAELVREKEQLIEAVEAERAKLQAQEDDLFALYHAGQVPKADFGRRWKPISERRAQVEEELPRLQAERDVLKINLHSGETILDETRNVATRWPDLPWEEKRQIVEAITDQVVIGPDGVEVSLLQLPSGEGGNLGPYPSSYGESVGRGER